MEPFAGRPVVMLFDVQDGAQHHNIDEIWKERDLVNHSETRVRCRLPFDTERARLLLKLSCSKLEGTCRQ